MKKFMYFTFCLNLMMLINSEILAQTSSFKKSILLDVAHNPKFYNDPAEMKDHDPNQVERVNYMTRELIKNASSQNAELKYLKDEIKKEHLENCDLLFIHIPSSKYSKDEVKVITQYLENGGSIFLVMDVDYWSTLEQTNVNDIISQFGIQFGADSPDELTGGYTKAGLFTDKALKINYHGGRIIKGGTPFCFKNETDKNPFGTFKQLKNEGKIVVMGDGMTSLYMTSWEGVDGYQCSEFMNEVFKWLLN